MSCAQTANDIDTISFAQDSPMSLPDCIKIWLKDFLPKFGTEVTYPLSVDLSVRGIKWQIARKW